jgi:methyltransferase
MVTFYLIFLALLGVERLVELRLSARNARWSMERGAVEVGQGHFGVMKALHSLFFLGCAAEVVCLGRPFVPALSWPMLGVALAAQGLRYWAIGSLGRRWNVRVIVLPDVPAVAHGPYRFLRHPNYVAVVLEGMAVPLIHGAWWTAVAFTLANALLLRVRIRCEEDALARFGAYGVREAA